MPSDFLRKLKNWMPPSRSFINHESIQTISTIKNTVLSAEQYGIRQDAADKELSELHIQIQDISTQAAATAEQLAVLTDRVNTALEQSVGMMGQMEAVQNLLSQLSSADENCRSQLESIQSILVSLSAKQDALPVTLNAMTAQLIHQEGILDTLPGQIALEGRATRETLPSKAFLINASFERSYYKDFPTSRTPDAPNFTEEFRALARNLDEESISTIVNALKRLQILQNTSEEILDLYSESEQAQGNIVIETLLKRVIQIADDCFFWNHFYLPINQFESCVFLDRCGVPLLTDPSYFDSKDIIDAGAFIGDSALIFSPLTSKFVHAFEPVPNNYELMQKTIALNGCQNVIPRPQALGAVCGTAWISINGSSSSQYENDAFQYSDKIEVPVTTIDDYVAEHNLQVGLIKADLEGAEQDMLQGAMNTIRTQRPTLLISIYHNASDFFHIKPILEELELGYRFRIFHPTFGSVMTETMLIAEIERI